MNTYTVVEQLNIGKYALLKVDRKISDVGYFDYMIDGEKHKAVIVYDLPQHIAIESTGDFLGKTVQCV